MCFVDDHQIKVPDAEPFPAVLPGEVTKFLRSGLKGRLIAWDPVAQEARWTVEHAGPWNGGVLSTAGGVVFQGKLNGEFSAYDAATGEELWTADVKSGAASGPGVDAASSACGGVIRRIPSGGPGEIKFGRPGGP